MVQKVGMFDSALQNLFQLEADSMVMGEVLLLVQGSEVLEILVVLLMWANWLLLALGVVLL